MQHDETRSESPVTMGATSAIRDGLAEGDNRMNSFPTELSPWYVVLQWKQLGHLGQSYYYTSVENIEGDPWTEDPRTAMLFLSLTHAIRTAKALNAEIVLLWNKAQLLTYGRNVGR